MKHATIAALVLAAAATALTLPAEAGSKHARGVRGHGHSHGHRHAPKHRVVVRPAPLPPHVVVVPHVIAPSRVAAYRPYYHGRVWHPGHHHHHAVYHFPVRAELGVAIEPHVYCGERRFDGGYVAYDGPRFSLRIAF